MSLRYTIAGEQKVPFAPIIAIIVTNDTRRFWMFAQSGLPGRRLVASHQEHLAHREALLHAHRDRSSREVLKITAHAAVARGVD